MAIYVGSARIDENGKIKGGKAGDQKQILTNGNDYFGEVSMQKMYTHSKGWYIIRPKTIPHANNLSARMIIACNNDNLGYDQNQRLGVLAGGTDCSAKTECDCSSLVRQCIKEACKKDPGNFTTADEVKFLKKSDLFLEKIPYVSQYKTPVYDGDILVTRTTGHTVIVVSGNPRPNLIIPVVNLKKGAKGSNVKNLQYCLNICGACLDTDSSFGFKTDSALRNWQSTYGLTPDGSYGPKSSKMMKDLLGK